MKIEVLTLFPEMFEAMHSGVIGKALDKGAFSINVTNIRDYSKDKHHKCDDAPFGGGAGMVMTPDPIHCTFEAVDPEHKYKHIYMSPKGRTLSQEIVEEYAKEEGLVFLCGSYEGIDQRVIDLDIDEELSIGDYVLTGGELACMVTVNAVARYIDGVLGSSESTSEESFAEGLLEYPQYTRPQEYLGLKVPDILLSGNHAEIAKWRHNECVKITRERRPDLLEKSKEEE